MRATRWFHTLIALAALAGGANGCLAQTKADASPVVLQEGDAVTGKTNAPPSPIRDRQPAATTTILTNAPAQGTNAPVQGSVPKALTLAEIMEMSGKGVSVETILNALRISGAVYILTTREINALQQAKVSETIIDYLLATPRRLPERGWTLPVYYPLPWPGFHHDHHSSFYHDYRPSYSHGLSHGIHR